MTSLNNKNISASFKVITLLAILVSLFVTGQSWAAQSASAYKTATRYNLNGQVTGTISPANVHTTGTNYPATRNTYSSSTGLLSRVETGVLSSWRNENIAPSNWSGFSVLTRVDYTYDNRGRKHIEKISSSNGSEATLTQYSYDEYDRLVCMAIRMNPSQYNNLPSSACTLGASGSYGSDRITKYEYEPSNTNVTKTQFDLLTHEYRAVGTSIEQVYRKNEYDSYGRVSYVTDANGNRARMIYDSRSRLQRWYFPSKTNPGIASTTDYERYTYDNNGNRTVLRKRDGRVIKYQHDKLNRVIKKDIPNSTSLDVYYDYDLQGLEQHARFGSDNGAGITRTFDGHGRKESESDNTSGTNRTLSFLHDNNGNRTRLTYPDNKYVVYSYDGLNRLDLINFPNSTGSIVNKFDAFARPISTERASNADTTYGYDGLSRLDELTDDYKSNGYDNTFDYDYNPASQMVQQDISNGSYHYDLSNEKGLNHSYGRNGLNQYTSVAGKSYGYDSNGNLTSDSSTTYTYDVENRLTRAAGNKNAVLTYDPTGRLSRSVADSTTTHFIYDGDALVLEYTGSTLSKRYVHSVEVDFPVAEYNGSATTANSLSYLHRNHQGSIIAASNNTGSGEYLKKYDAFGQMQGSTQGRFAYTGQIYLPELDLYHYKARAYNASIGRFMQTDPVGYEDQMNLYGYVHNNPLNLNDSTGQCSTDPNSSADDQCQHASNLNLSSRGEAHIKKFENDTGNLDVHDDGAGNPTAGYGHKVTPADNLKIGDKVSQQLADQFFAGDVANAETVVENLVGTTPVSQNEFDSLVDTAFNVGPGKLDVASSPGLNAAIQAADYEGMSNNLAYTKANGKVLPGLVNRSAARKVLFRGNIQYKNP